MSTPYDPPARLQERITDPESQLAEEQTDRTRIKAALAGALHVSGASEDTLVEFVARLYIRAAESEAQCARMREVLNACTDPRDHRPVLDKIREALSSTAGADLLREDAALRKAESNMEAIRIRCVEGDPRSDWIPVIRTLAEEVLSAVADARRKP